MKGLNAPALKKTFEDNGYIVVPDFLTRERIQDINLKLKTFIRKKIHEMPNEYLFYEDKNDFSTLKQMQHLFAYSPYFKQILLGSKFMELAEILLEEKVVGKELEYFNKPPKIGKPTPPSPG